MIMSTSFNWFKGLPDPPKPKIIPQPHKPTYRDIAKDKQKTIEFILENPQDLFKVVDYENNCMCGGNYYCECTPSNICRDRMGDMPLKREQFVKTGTGHQRESLQR